MTLSLRHQKKDQDKKAKYTGERKAACYTGVPVEKGFSTHPQWVEPKPKRQRSGRTQCQPSKGMLQILHTSGFTPVEVYEIPSHLPRRV